MTRTQDKTAASIVKEALTQDRDFFVAVLQPLIQEALEHQMDLSLGAGKSERTSDRVGYRSGYYTGGLTTRVGHMELRVPQDRQGRFSTSDIRSVSA